MFFNRLYQLITKDKPSFIEKSQLIAKRHAQNGTPFVIYMLSGGGKKSISNAETNSYYLDSDHLSFYETIDRQNPYLSEYHYTAYLIDDKNKQYQLHVYFNERDQLTIAPVLTLLDDTGEQLSQQISNIVSQGFITLAQTRSCDFIRQLRADHALKLNALQTTYQSAERALAALSIDLEKNHHAYIQQLDITSEKLEKLANFSDNPFYRATLKRFLKIKQLLMASQNKPFITSDTASSETMPSELAKTTMPVVEEMSNISIKAKNSKKSAAQRIEVIRALECQFNEIKDSETPLKNQVETFVAFYSEIQDTLLLIDDNAYVTTARDLHVLQRLSMESSRQGEELLKLALLKKEFDTATRLSKFAPFLSENMIKISLSTNNAALLDFLLTHCHIPINTFIVKDNLTPVLFCLKTSNQAKNKEVFQVLIKHNASLMVNADDELPVVYHILRALPTHPLYTCLAGPMSQSSFWVQLIGNLQNYLSDHPKLPASNKSRLLHDIESLKNTRLMLTESSSLNTSSTGRILEGLSNLSKNFTAAQLDKIRNDAELNRKQNTLELLTIKYNKLCNAAEQRTNARNNRSVINHLDQLLKNFDFSEHDAEELKNQNLDFFDNRIEHTTLAIQLKKLQRHRVHTTIHSLNKWQNQQKEIVSRMNALDEPYAYMNPDSKISADLKAFTDFFNQYNGTEPDNESDRDNELAIESNCVQQ